MALRPGISYRPGTPVDTVSGSARFPARFERTHQWNTCLKSIVSPIPRTAGASEPPYGTSQAPSTVTPVGSTPPEPSQPTSVPSPS